MAADPKQELKDLIEEYKKLTGKPFTIFNPDTENDLKKINQGIDILKKGIESAKDEAFNLDGKFAGLRKTLKAVTDEFKGINSGSDKTKLLSKEITKEYSKLEKIAKDLQYDQEGISKLSERELKDILKKTETSQQEIKSKSEAFLEEKKAQLGLSELGEKELAIKAALKKGIIENGKLSLKQLPLIQEISKTYGITGDQIKNIASKIKHVSDEEEAIIRAYKEENDEVKTLTDQTQKRLEKEQAINKQLGIFGGVLKGIGKIPILGDLVDTEKALKVAGEATEANLGKAGAGLKGLKAGLGNLKGQFMDSITNPANIALFAITQFMEALQISDKGAGDLAKDFNMTYDEANKTRMQLTEMGNLSGDVALNTRALQESMVAVGKSLGTNAQLNEADLKTFTKLREQAGFANDELVEMQKLTLATGGNLEDNTANLMFAAKATALNNKVTLNEKDIMRDVAKLSKATALSLGGNPVALGKAVAQAKALGMNMGQIEKSAEALLNFEDSIGNEIEAELLTGKELNLEQARFYALTNDSAGLARELAKNFGTAAEFGKMNRIQQEAAAKAVGMSREELAQTLTDKEALAKVNIKDVDKAKEALAYARAQGMTDEQIAKADMKKLMEQQSMQERLNNSVEKLKEIFISIAEPVLGILNPLMTIVTTVLPLINMLLSPIAEGFRVMGVAVDYIGKAWDGFTSKLEPIMPVLKGIGIAVLAILSPLIAAAGIAAFMALAGIPIVGPILATAAAIGAISFLTTKVTGVKVSDGMIAPDGGLMVSGEKGTYQLDKNDTVIAGTDLGKVNDATINPNGALKESKNKGTYNSSSSTNIDLTPLIEEIKGMRATLNQILSREGVVYLDGDKVGKTLALATYKTQ